MVDGGWWTVSNDVLLEVVYANRIRGMKVEEKKRRAAQVKYIQKVKAADQRCGGTDVG